MKKTFLILSILLSGCKSMDTYPEATVIIIDLQNVQCRYYRLVDKEKVLFDGPIARHNLYQINSEGKTVPNQACEGTIGYLPRDFKKVQNWARDIQGSQK